MASKFQNKITSEYKKLGYKVVNLMKTNDNGITDLMCLKEGKVIFIECKEDGDTLKPLQKYKIDCLRNLGFEAFCLHESKGKIY